jgi:hypothetical protein
MSVKFAVAAAIALISSNTAHAADIIGTWAIHGSVFFNAVDTTCLFKAEGDGIAATCENDGKPGDYTPATVAGGKVLWNWNAGPAVLTFDGAFTSDTMIKGKIAVRGFTGSFTATKQSSPRGKMMHP